MNTASSPSSFHRTHDLRPRLDVSKNPSARRKPAKGKKPAPKALATPSSTLVAFPPKSKEVLFDQMFTEMRSRFLALAYSILRSPEDAEDAVQEAFLSGYRCLPGFEGRSALTTWFTRIVMNASLLILRKRKTSRLQFTLDNPTESEESWAQSIPDPSPNPESLYARRESHRVVDDLLHEVSPRLREAFLLRHDDEHSMAEAARAAGVTRTNFKARLFRARQHLSQNTAYLFMHGKPKPLRPRVRFENGRFRSLHSGCDAPGCMELAS